MAALFERRVRRRDPGRWGALTGSSRARWLDALPVPAALEADDAPEARRLEVPRGHEGLLALEPLDERAPGLSRQVRVHVGARHPVGLVELHGIVRRVAENERALAPRGDQDAHVTRRVA